MSRQLKLTILLPGFYVGEDDTPEDVEAAMCLDSENVIVVLSGHEGDSPGTVLRSLEGRIIDYGIRGVGVTPSFAEATAAARRIERHNRVLHSGIGEPKFEKDARLLAGFVLAGDTERLRPENEPRPLTMQDRAVVAARADQMLDDGYIAHADALIDAVRCCGEFPECSHVLALAEGGV